jgi:hypothetical protein
MFNVTRPSPRPNCSRDYRSKEVIDTLREIFYGKCYLCEDKVSDPIIEHFIPHQGDPIKEHDWNNLYYACHRCNSVKGDTYKDILDCCDNTIDVFRTIKCLCPSIPDHDIIVEAQNAEDQKTVNTACLLHNCYNLDNTALRGISRGALHERIFGYYCNFIKQRIILKNEMATTFEKQEAIERLKKMTDVAFPFSVFWKWHILSDEFLSGVCDFLNTNV